MYTPEQAAARASARATAITDKRREALKNWIAGMKARRARLTPAERDVLDNQLTVMLGETERNPEFIVVSPSGKRTRERIRGLSTEEIEAATPPEEGKER